MIRCFFWLNLLALLYLFSCAHKNLSIDSQTRFIKNDNDSNLYIKRAHTLYNMGEIQAAIAILRSYVDNNVYHEGHDKAYELIVEWLLQINQRKEAQNIASYFLSHHGESPSTKKIITLFESLPKDKQYETQKNNEAEEQLFLLESLYLDEKNASIKEMHFSKLADYILFQAPLALAKSIAQKKIKSSFGLANARLAMHYFHLGNFNDSYNHASIAIPKLPHPQQSIALELKNQIEQIRQIDQRSIGIILPLSGPFQAFGKKILSAMSIAFDMPLKPPTVDISICENNDFKIIIADSKGDPSITSFRVENLVKNYHVALIIGEITHEPSLVAAQICQQFGVPMLSLSRHPLIAHMGQYIFAFNSSPQQEIDELVNYAMDIKHYKKFAILFPRHNYGMTMSKLFFDRVIKKGGSISAIEAYDTHETTFFTPVKKLLGKYYLRAHEQYVECEKIAKQETNTSNKKNSLELCRLSIKPTTDFEALFIPEFYKVAFIVPALIQEDLLINNDSKVKQALSLASKIKQPQYVQLLGTDSWHDKNIIEKIGHEINGAYFIDSVSFDNDSQFQDFFKTYKNMNTFSPSSWEIFAHDAAKLAINVLKSLAQDTFTREHVRQRIINFNGRVGLFDNVSFLPQGELKTPLLGFEIIDGKEKIVSGTKKS
jgi:ABC-type branched-subunit amino acid transport system substrate-binding protein